MARSKRPLRIVALGDTAVLLEFSEVLDLETNALIQRVARALRQLQQPWIRDIVPALGSLALHFDMGSVPPDVDPLARAGELVAQCLRGKLQVPAAEERPIEVPVCYEGDLGVDLEEVASGLKMRAEDVVRLHVSSNHRVLMMGFAPGHPYIGGQDARLAVPRRATPRTAVPAGSVAIANAQTAVYPFTISGGWNIIGRTPLSVFDIRRDPPALFAPGSPVRFTEISRPEFDRLSAAK